MNQKNFPWVICLLMLLAPAALCPQFNTDRTPNDQAATDTAVFYTQIAAAKTSMAVIGTVAAAATQTSVAATQAKNAAPLTQTAFFASQPASTPRPTKTATPTRLPGATATNTPGPAVSGPAPITDLCALVDPKLLATITGDTFAQKHPYPAANGYNACYTVGAHGTYAILSGAQGDVAATVLLQDYAAIEAATSCDYSKLQPAGQDGVDKARAELAQAGVQPDSIVAGVLSHTFTLVTAKGCAGKNEWALVPGLGDSAVADNSFGVLQTRVAIGQTLIGVSLTQANVSDANELPLEVKWVTAVVQQLAAK